jgi:hypothetical protein
LLLRSEVELRDGSALVKLRDMPKGLAFIELRWKDGAGERAAPGLLALP